MSAAICLACDDNYFPYACITARAALETTSADLPVFIIHDGISDRSHAEGRAYLGAGFYSIDADSILSNYDFHISYLSRATYLRLFIDKIPELREFSKIIYLDCDVLVLKDVSLLLQTRHLAGPMVAAHDLRYLVSLAHRDYLPMAADSPYFNAGVLYMDLEWLREEALLEHARRFAADHVKQCIAHDQDALNVAFQHRWQTLDWRWNVTSMFPGHMPVADAYLRHFTGIKPWIAGAFADADTKHRYRQLFADSPWPDRFRGETLSLALRMSVRLALKSAEERLKTGMLGRAAAIGSARRSRRSRLLSGMRRTLDAIAEDAAHCRPARRSPELSLIF